MDVDRLAEQLCSSPIVEQSPVWEQIWHNRTRGRQQLLRQLVGVLTQKHGDEGLRVATLWLQARPMSIISSKVILASYA